MPQDCCCAPECNLMQYLVSEERAIMKTAFNNCLLELAKIWYIFLLVGKEEGVGT